MERINMQELWMKIRTLSTAIGTSRVPAVFVHEVLPNLLADISSIGTIGTASGQLSDVAI